MFSYSGWNAAAYIAEEVRDPGRNVPLALGLARSRSSSSMGAQRVVSLRHARLRTRGARRRPARGHGRERLFGFTAGNVVAGFTIVSLAAKHQRHGAHRPARCTTRWREMARSCRAPPTSMDGSARRRRPSSCRRLERRARALRLVVAARELYRLRDRVCSRRLAVASLFVLRRREPGVPRPFSAWGYPWAPGSSLPRARRCW